MQTEGQLVHDPKLRRYKIVGQPGKEEYHLHGGEKLELFVKGQWIPVRIEILGDAQNKASWKFLNERNEPVLLEAGQRTRLITVTQPNRK